MFGGAILAVPWGPRRGHNGTLYQQGIAVPRQAPVSSGSHSTCGRIQTYGASGLIGFSVFLCLAFGERPNPYGQSRP